MKLGGLNYGAYSMAPLPITRSKDASGCVLTPSQSRLSCAQSNEFERSDVSLTSLDLSTLQTLSPILPLRAFIFVGATLCSRVWYRAVSACALRALIDSPSSQRDRGRGLSQTIIRELTILNRQTEVNDTEDLHKPLQPAAASHSSFHRDLVFSLRATSNPPGVVPTLPTFWRTSGLLEKRYLSQVPDR